MDHPICRGHKDDYRIYSGSSSCSHSVVGDTRKQNVKNLLPLNESIWSVTSPQLPM